MTFTPGPWVKDYGGTLGHIKSVAERDDGATPTVARYDLAALFISEEEREANARLIAASPKMFAACQLALIQFGANEDYSDDDKEAVDALREAIRAALEGEEEE